MEKSLTKGQPAQISNTLGHEMSLWGVGVLGGTSDKGQPDLKEF